MFNPEFSNPEKPPERFTQILSPEQVFDSSIIEAKKQAKSVAEMLEKAGPGMKNIDVELRITPESSRKNEVSSPKHKKIQIIWKSKNNYMLELIPVTEGKGVDSVVVGYSGRYGRAEKDGEKTEFRFGKDVVSLEQLYGCPKGIRLIIFPTKDRWSIERDTLHFRSDAFNLYMGLGFLLNDMRWMVVGNHEIGHIPKDDIGPMVSNENSAWTRAKTQLANTIIGRGLQKEVATGSERGPFDIYRKPQTKSDLTIGMIERFGITSHFLQGNANIPRSWRGKESIERVLRLFGEHILQAQQAFDRFLVKKKSFERDFDEDILSWKKH